MEKQEAIYYFTRMINNDTVAKITAFIVAAIVSTCLAKVAVIM